MESAIQLAATIPALSQATLLSNRLTFPFKILQFAITFPSGCDNLLLAYPILSFDSYTSTTAVPGGTNLLSPISPRHYLLGDNITITIPTGRIVLERGARLKAHFVNNDSAPHTPSAIFTIREYLEDTT